MTTIERPRIGWQPRDMNQHIVRLISRRQQHECNERHLKRQTHFNRSLLNRLNVEHCLKGHEGCVNCLEWSKDGRILASGSDDTRIRIWDPFANKCLNVVPTRHIGNIFSVKFIGDGSMVATGAADQRVMVLSVNSTSSNTVHMECYCHTGRVKRLATCPDQPLLFWSAAEDGIAMQYDLRVPHDCSKGSGTVFVDLSSMSDLKSIAVNPIKTHLVAIGADDCYIRLFDRRMIRTHNIKRRTGTSSTTPDPHLDPEWFITTQSPSSPSPPPPATPPPSYQGMVRYYAPGHLAKDGGGDLSHKLATTYVTFDEANGDWLLANMGGEHIYLFDLLEEDEQTASRAEGEKRSSRLQVPSGVGMETNTDGDGFRCWEEQHEHCGCEMRENTNAFSHIDVVQSETVGCGCDYIRRAASLCNRKWFGDIYAGARDYYHVIKKYPLTLSAYRGLINCLVSLRWNEEARAWISYVQQLFGDSPVLHERLQLTQIKAQIESNENDGRSSMYYSRDSTNPDNDLDMDSPPRSGSNSADNIGNVNVQHRPMTAFAPRSVPPAEVQLRLQAQDYCTRYVGHCNTTTDIKEANFLGVDNRYIAAGSDDGLIFFWDRSTGEVVNALQGDPSIVNCIQPHPSVCVLATSGIDKVVKIWSPEIEDGRKNGNRRDASKAMALNQQRMALDPFETILVDMGVNISGRFPDTEQVIGIPSCNTS